MNKNIVVFLDITSWAGMSLGAEHYYGKIIGYIDGEYKTIEVQKPMTEEEARKFREKDDWAYYKAGSMTSRFERREHVIEAAVKICREHYPTAKALLIGKPAYSGPKRFAYCDSEVVKAAGDALYELAESIGWWDHPKNHKAMESIDAAWDDLLKLLEAA